MLVLPLIISSLVTGRLLTNRKRQNAPKPADRRATLSLSGISTLDNRAPGKMGMRAAIYYMLTTLIAVFIGVCIVTIIKPGKGSRDTLAGDERNMEPVPTADAFLDLIR